MADLQVLIEQLNSLTLGEIGDLAERLEKQWGVVAKQAFVPTVNAKPQVVETKPVEQTEFTVTLVDVGEKRIDVIKAIRLLTQWDLMTSRNFVDTVPSVLFADVSKEQADAAKIALEEVGASVTVS